MATTSALSRAASPGAQRLLPLDTLRGVIMALMALDHANYFVAQQHPPGEHWGGPFPIYSSALPFLTRLVTHPVAPGFAFLMGAGMALFAISRRKQGWSEWALTRHFLIRGALLIALQLIVVNRAWELGPSPFPRIYIGVLVALGGGMILGSLLLRLNPGPLLTLSLALFIVTELSHPDPAQWGRIFDQPLGLILGYSGGDLDFWSNYPVLPWLELITFGMLFGHWLARDSRQALGRSLPLGIAFLLTFLALRSLDGFGNIRPRSGEGWIAFLNVVKYPPAMTFTLLTMGLNLLLLRGLAWLAGLRPGTMTPLAVFGRAPLFFYLLHLFLYAAMGLWLTPGGTSLTAMYPLWLLGLVALYPLSRWYGSFKARQPASSILKYL